MRMSFPALVVAACLLFQALPVSAEGKPSSRCQRMILEKARFDGDAPFHRYTRNRYALRTPGSANGMRHLHPSPAVFTPPQFSGRIPGRLGWTPYDATCLR